MYISRQLLHQMKKREVSYKSHTLEKKIEQMALPVSCNVLRQQVTFLLYAYLNTHGKLDDERATISNLNNPSTNYSSYFVKPPQRTRRPAVVGSQWGLDAVLWCESFRALIYPCLQLVYSYGTETQCALMM